MQYTEKKIENIFGIFRKFKEGREGPNYMYLHGINPNLDLHLMDVVEYTWTDLMKGSAQLWPSLMLPYSWEWTKLGIHDVFSPFYRMDCKIFFKENSR